MILLRSDASINKIGVYMNQREQLYQKLAGQKVWIPCTKQPDGSITLELLLNQKGEQYIPSFCNRKSGEGKIKGTLVEIDFTVLRHILLELPEQICGIVLEPFQENILFDRTALNSFDKAITGMDVRRHVHSEDLILEIPAHLPEGLINTLQGFFEKEENVNRAWILLAKEKAEDVPYLYFAVDYRGDRISLFPKLAEKIKPFMKPGERFELTEYGTGMERMSLKKALIYEKDKP